MAQLKDTLIQGSARVTDTLYTTTAQLTNLLAPTTAGGTTYGPGTNEYVLMSNGTSIYWGTGVSNAIKALDASFTGATNKTLTALTQTDGKITTATFSDIAINESQVTWTNNTLYVIGDDAYIGDVNVAGHLGVKGKNGNTGIMFVTYNQDVNTTGGKITWNGTQFTMPRAEITQDIAAGTTGQLLKLTNSRAAANIAANQWFWGTDFLVTNTIANTNVCHVFGKANSTKNSGVLNYHHAGDGSDSNYVGLGLYAAEDIWQVYGSKTAKLSSAYNTANSALITATSTGAGTSGSFYWGYAHLLPNLVAGANTSGFVTGVAANTGNSAYFGFHYEGSNNASSYISLGMYGYNHLLTIYRDGTVRATKFQIGATTTALSANSLVFAQGGGWNMTDATWIRTVGSKSVYMNAGTFRNDGTTQVRTLQHINSNIVVDGDWVSGTRGKAPTATITEGTTTYSGAVLGTSILTIGNNKVYGNTASGVDDNAQGYLRIYGPSSSYAQVTVYAGDKLRLYPEEGISIPPDKIGIMFRPNSSSYYVHVSHQTNGNEALVAATQNAVTSFIFVNGESYANVASARWTKLTGNSGEGAAPGLQIKQNCVSIGKLIASNTNATYKLQVYGGKTYLNNNTASSNANLSSQFIIANESGGNVALELWRNSNASWQFANESGNLYIRNNYTTARQNTYSQTSISIAYNTGNTTFAGSVTANGGFTGSLAGNATSATTATYSYYPKIVAGNEIRFDVNTKPSAATQIHIGHAWSDGSKDAKITGYIFKNGNGATTGVTVTAETFSGVLSGNASTATAFKTAQSIALTGDVTGSASSTAGWSISTTLANSGASAGSYGDSSAQTPGYGGTFKVPYVTVDVKGRVTSISEHTVTIPASDNTNTTYTFSGGTNGFTVTPSGGSAQTVTVTPSIANNITGSGTANYVAMFNGTNTITSSTALSTFVRTYARTDIGDAPNFDNPGVNGIFELRPESETGSATGTRPFNGFAPFINFTAPYTLFQLAGNNTEGFYIRGIQQSSPTLNGVAWLKLVTDTFTGNVSINGNLAITGTGHAITISPWGGSYGTSGTGMIWYCGTDATQSDYVANTIYIGNTGNTNLYAAKIYNAIWNDYAECRKTKQDVQYGQCVIDNNDGSLSIAEERLLPGAQVVSDTWGHIMGETKEAKTPVAVAGRVLVYPYRDRSEYHAGQAVCTAPNGTVDIMSREEIMMYPDCIVGIVSEIPDYDTWGTGNVKVNGRIWIKVR